MTSTPLFWSIAVVLMALVALILSWPLLRRRQVAAAVSNRAINASIYREQLAELVSERDSGALSESDYHAAHTELERRLIEDTRNDPVVQSSDAGNKRAVRTVVALLLAIPLVAIPLYLWLGNPAALGSGSSRSVAAHEGSGSMAEMDQLAATLAEKLEKNPNNPEGWVMLGRTYKMLGRFDEAEQAYLHAGNTANEESALMLERVELALDRNRGSLDGAAQKLLDEVLKKEPGNPRAKFIAGVDAFGHQDYRKAISYWEALLKQVPPDSQDASNLASSIAEARARLGGKASAMTEADASATPSSVTAPTADTASIRGKVSLAPALKAKASPSDTVFIFARAPQGPPMPLAAIRVTVADLPLEFTLDDSLAMSPQTKLSLFKTVRVEARVAKSGDVAAKSGDLAGSIESVKVGTTGVALNIDRVLP